MLSRDRDGGIPGMTAAVHGGIAVKAAGQVPTREGMRWVAGKVIGPVLGKGRNQRDNWEGKWS